METLWLLIGLGLVVAIWWCRNAEELHRRRQALNQNRNKDPFTGRCFGLYHGISRHDRDWKA